MSRLIAIILCSFMSSHALADATWQEQATRVEQINATFLDAAPFGDPIGTEKTSVGVQAVVTYLPKVSPNIGAKSESVPSSPIHTIPLFSFQQNAFTTKIFSLGYKLYAGYLPTGSERLIHLPASLTQTAYGFTLFPAVSIRGPKSQLYFPIGYQKAKATVKGAITEAGSNDRFTTNTSLLSFGIGYFDQSGLFADVLIMQKKTTATFDIEVDQTSIPITDNLMSEQISAGFVMASNFRFGAGYWYVPQRLKTARILFGYDLTL